MVFWGNVNSHLPTVLYQKSWGGGGGISLAAPPDYNAAQVLVIMLLLIHCLTSNLLYEQEQTLLPGKIINESFFLRKLLTFEIE